MEKARKKLMIISNRKLCKEGLLNRLRKIFDEYKKGQYLGDFVIEGLVLREKDLDKYAYYKLLSDVYEICKTYGINLYAHKYWDLAKVLDIKYIHMPIGDLINLAKNKEEYRIFRDFFERIGVSTHSIEELVVAKDLGASHIFAGHIFPTACKEGLEGRGLDFLNDMCKKSSIPIYAIGGIGPEKVDMVIDKGAHGVAMMSTIMAGIGERTFDEHGSSPKSVICPKLCLKNKERKFERGEEQEISNEAARNTEKFYFMSQAILEAKKAYCLKETPIGAVVVHKGVIVGRGFNQVELTKDPTRHAEIVAIQDAAKKLGRWRLYDCQMYVTMEPCLMCAGAIENSRINTIHIAASHKKNHLVEKHNKFKEEVYMDRKIDYKFGLLEEEASKLLTSFFRERRLENKRIT